MWVITCFSAIIIVAIVEKLITNHIDRIGNTSHSSTRKLHKDFHRALLAMLSSVLQTQS
ncbi:hypothetical protein AAVH_17939 [Aphelenchoides avenae]|nr:hypothetical protein AAVH_17939 [Aphelenchus avenae]